MEKVIAKRDGFMVGTASPGVVPEGGLWVAVATLTSLFDPGSSATVRAGAYRDRPAAEEAAQRAAEELAAIYSGTNAAPPLAAYAWEAVRSGRARAE